MHHIDLFITNLDKACQLNPKYYKDTIQREAAAKRMRAAIIFSLFGISITVFQTLTQQTPISNGIYTIVIGFSIIISVLLTRNSHPQVFKILFSTLLAISGPVLKYLNEKGFYRAWMGIHVYPLIVFMCTGSIKHYLFQSVLQIFYITKLYQDDMISSLNFLSAEVSAHLFIQGSKSLSYLAMFQFKFPSKMLMKRFQSLKKKKVK